MKTIDFKSYICKPAASMHVIFEGSVDKTYFVCMQVIIASLSIERVYLFDIYARQDRLLATDIMSVRWLSLIYLYRE